MIETNTITWILTFCLFFILFATVTQIILRAFHDKEMKKMLDYSFKQNDRLLTHWYERGKIMLKLFNDIQQTKSWLQDEELREKCLGAIGEFEEMQKNMGEEINEDEYDEKQ